MPTQIGSTLCPSASLSRTMGMLVTGSTMRPLIVISICTAILTLGFGSDAVKLGQRWRHGGIETCHIAVDTVRARLPNRHSNRGAQPFGRPGKAHDGVAERTSRQ